MFTRWCVRLSVLLLTASKASHCRKTCVSSSIMITSVILQILFLLTGQTRSNRLAALFSVDSCMTVKNNSVTVTLADLSGPPPSTIRAGGRRCGGPLRSLCSPPISWPRPQSSIIVWQEHKQRRDKHTLITSPWQHASTVCGCCGNQSDWSAWFRPQPKVSGHTMPTFSFMVSLSEDEHRVGEGQRPVCVLSL